MWAVKAQAGQYFTRVFTVCQSTLLRGFPYTNVQQCYWSHNPDHFLVSWFLFVYYQGYPNVPSVEIGSSADPDEMLQSATFHLSLHWSTHLRGLPYTKGQQCYWSPNPDHLLGKPILVCILPGISKCSSSWNWPQCRFWWNAAICSISSVSSPKYPFKGLAVYKGSTVL